MRRSSDLVSSVVGRSRLIRSNRQGLSNPTKISVYNLLGKLVLSKTTSSEINVDNLQSGIYIIKIVDEQKEIIRKFIKN